MIRPFDIRDVSVIQRLRPLARTLAYETTAVDGVNLLRDALSTYVTGRRDSSVVLVDRERLPELECFGLMHILPETPQTTDGQKRAALVMMAPGPQSDELVESWMMLAQEFAAHAASHGVHHVVAEPPEYGGEAEALQAAGFAPLMHQDVLKLASLASLGENNHAFPKLTGLRNVTRADEAIVRMMHMRAAPKMTYQAEITSDLLRATIPSEEGWVIEQGSEIVGYVALREGRRGCGLQMMFRPKAEELAEPMLRHALHMIKKRKVGPIYCTLRAYQSWLLPVLDSLGFAHITSTVLMVRHTAARIQSPVWATRAIPANALATRKVAGTFRQIHRLAKNTMDGFAANDDAFGLDTL